MCSHTTLPNRQPSRIVWDKRGGWNKGRNLEKLFQRLAWVEVEADEPSWEFLILRTPLSGLLSYTF